MRGGLGLVLLDSRDRGGVLSHVQQMTKIRSLRRFRGTRYKRTTSNQEDMEDVDTHSRCLYISCDDHLLFEYSRTSCPGPTGQYLCPCHSQILHKNQWFLEGCLRVFFLKPVEGRGDRFSPRTGSSDRIVLTH